MTDTAPQTRDPLSGVAVVRAFVYLQATSTFNAIRQRLRRLRQPKYLFGAIAGAAYFYLVLFRRMSHGAGPGPTRFAPPPDVLHQLAAIGGVAVLVVAAFAWIVPSRRAALQLSEAEVAFLLPAPVTRKTLIHFSLLRSQFAILLSSLLLSLLLRPGGGLGGNAWQHAIALWLALSMFQLHSLGASFVRERLLDLGVRPLLRRAIAVGLIVLVAASCWWWLRAHAALPTAADLANGDALYSWIAGVLGAPPVSWVLAPFRAVIAPVFATTTAEFLRALVPAVLLLVAHYLWVVHSNVAFEEASIERARKRAEWIARRAGGNSVGRQAPKKARSAPFRLGERGPAVIAFLWKGLIAMGPFWRLRTFVVACAVVIAGTWWLGSDPDRNAILVVPAISAMMLVPFVLLLGPSIAQGGLRRTLERLDILKSAPLRGWQIALGELLTPVAVMSFALWFLLLTVGVSLGQLKGNPAHPEMVPAGLCAIALVAPLLAALMLCVPFAGQLYFPAWTATPDGGRGVEVMGQRLIFAAGNVLALGIALLPAAFVGGIAFMLVRSHGGLVAATLVGAVLVAAVLVVELVFAIDLLGRRIDAFDLSQEMR